MSQHSHNDQTSIPGPRANQSCRAFALRALLAFAVATPATSAFAVDFPQPGPNPLSAVNGVLTDSGEGAPDRRGVSVGQDGRRPARHHGRRRRLVRHG